MDFAVIVNGLGTFLNFMGVLVIVGGVILAVLSYLSTAFSHQDVHRQYTQLRNNLGRAILLGLEILVAGDIIRSVTGTPTLDKVLVLVLIVLIRSFLGIIFEMEVEGRWPWQKNKSSQ